MSAAAAGCFLLLAAAMAVFGRFDSNEGWYWNDAWLVSQGLIPYRDFFLHRGPLMPFVFALPARLAGGDFLAGRVFAATLCAAVYGLSVSLAARLSGRTASIVCGILLLTAPVAVYFFTTVQTYALVAALYLAAAHALAPRRPGRLRWGVAGFFLASAWACRYPTDYVPLAALGTAALCGGASAAAWTAMGMSLPTAAWLASATAGPLERAWLQTGVFNLTLADRLTRASVLEPTMFSRHILDLGRLVSETCAHFPALAVAAGVLLFLPAGTGGFATLFFRLRSRPAMALMLLLALGNTAFYLTAHGSAYMQTSFVLPLVAVLAGTALAPLIRKSNEAERNLVTLAGLVLAGVSSAAALPPLHPRAADLMGIRLAGREIRGKTAPNTRLITWSPVLAPQSGRRLVPGLEMELYSFDSSGDSGIAGLLSGEVLEREVETAGGVAVVLDGRFSETAGMGRLLEAVRPAIAGSLRLHYTLVSSIEVPGYVRGRTDIYTPMAGVTPAAGQR